MSKSEELFKRAQEIIPGGVNSPVRAFRAVGGNPLFIKRGEGSHIWDVDGREYIDYVGSWGPLIFGHRPPEVVKALEEILHIGTSFGAPTEREVQLAELIRKFFPSVEKVRLVNSGTEATMSAIRLARGFTGRDRIVKFDGCYHGHADSLLVKAGSGVATLGLPDSPGVPRALAALTLTAPYNDLGALEEVFRVHPSDRAAAVVERVAGNMGCVPPRPGLLARLRALAGKPPAVAAGITTLELLRRPGFYERLNAVSEELTDGLASEAARAGVALAVNRVGSMFTAFFSPEPVTDYASARKSDTAAF